MCRLFFSFHNKNTKQKIVDFLKQSSQKRKNTPGIDNHRDLLNHDDGYGLAWIKDDNWNIYKKPVIYTKDFSFESCINRIPKEIVIGHIRKIHKNIIDKILNDDNIESYVIFDDSKTIQYLDISNNIIGYE